MPTWGKIKKLTLAGGVCRGLFCHDGVRSGALFAVGGTTLYAINAAWAASAQGAIVGSRPVLMDGFDSNLLILGDDQLYQYRDATVWTTLAGSNWTTLAAETWDFESAGVATLIEINNVNLPANPETLAVLAERALTSERGTDVFDWSTVGNAESWPAGGFASSQARPDAIKAQIVVGSYLYSLNSETTQIWRAVGGADADAFDTLGSEPIERGLLTRDAACQVEQSLMWIGDDRMVHRSFTGSFLPTDIVNLDLEQRLKVHADGTDPAEGLICFAHRDGSRQFFVARLADDEAFAYDATVGRWHNRSSWSASAYQGAFYAQFNGQHVVASPDSADIWIWDDKTYADDGEILPREMTVFVPMSGPQSITSIILDMSVFGQPVAGQGSDPVALVTYYADGGRTEESADQRTVQLGGLGDTRRVIKMTNFGRFDGNAGFLLRIRITDPVGFLFRGIYVNEDPSS